MPPSRARMGAARVLERAAQRLSDDARPASDHHPIPVAPPDREGWDNRAIELLLGFTLAPDATYVDVGANEGRFLWHALRHAPQGRHFAFEPVPALADQLRRAFQSGVVIHEVAVSDSAGEATFNVVAEDYGYSGLQARDYPGDWKPEEITVQVARLDDLLPAGQRVDVLKIDVEGGELGVLRGARETILRERPTVIVEHGVGSSSKYDASPDDVWSFLTDDACLRLFDLDAGGPYDRDGFIGEVMAGRRWNWVARP